MRGVCGVELAEPWQPTPALGHHVPRVATMTRAAYETKAALPLLGSYTTGGINQCYAQHVEDGDDAQRVELGEERNILRRAIIRESNSTVKGMNGGGRCVAGVGMSVVHRLM